MDTTRDTTSPPARRHRRGRCGHLVGGLGGVRGLPDGAGQLFHAAGRALQVAGRVFGAVGQVVVALRDLAGRRGNAFGGSAHFRDQLAQRCHHVAQAVEQRAGWRGRNGGVQIAPSHFGHHRNGFSRLAADLAQYRPRHQQSHSPYDQHDGEHDGQVGQQGLAHQLVDVIGVQA